MKRILFLLVLFAALPSLAATLSWDPPTYTDGSPISQTDLAEITYWPRYGNTPSGPWINAPYTDLCTAQLPDPHKGKTMWYTVAAELYGQFSVYPPPVSKSAKGKR